MRGRWISLAGLLLLSDPGATAPRDDQKWVAAWARPPSPQPPGTSESRINLSGSTNIPPRSAFLPTTNGTQSSIRIVPANETPPLSNVTLRELVRVSVAGRKLRLRLSNEGGHEALHLGAVRIAEAGPDGEALLGTDHVVTFQGAGDAIAPPGAPLLSDPINMPVKALKKLAVTIFVPGPIDPGGHPLWQYVSSEGDHSGETILAGARLMRVGTFVTQLEVQPDTARNVVVALGDSITEGAMSTDNEFRSWPDRLAERLNANPAGREWSVVNAGINGNRLARNNTGPDALARFDRDVLSVPGVKAVILLEGINDIGRPFVPEYNETPVTLAELISADVQLINRAHAHGIRVIGATLTPYEGAHYYDRRGEAVREGLNNWILTGKAFDGVTDFDAVVRDPNRPTAILKRFNEYDHLHPNDAGYAAMADSIDLKLITGR